jgi:hypothetical protein
MRGLMEIEKQRRGGGNGGGRTAQTVRIPAPVKGWNTSAPVQVLDPQEAVVLTNVVCRATGVETREGSIAWATGLGARVDTLMEYAPASGGGKFFAAAGSSIFDVTSNGTVGAPVVTGLTSAYFRHTMMATPAAQFLFVVNGSDAPRHFNGTSWTTPTITGVTPENLTNVTAHKNRLWFVEKNTLTAWYLPTSSIAGTAVAFPFGGYCKRGGYLVALGAWSRDGGDGADDLFVAVTSEGETLIWAGTDPASALTWSLVGVFQIPPPIGPRCLVKSGADLGVATARGIVSLDVVLAVSASLQPQTALTRKIDDEFLNAWTTVGYSEAWQVLEAPQARIVLVNVPTTTIKQYCLSVETGGWSLFEGISSTAWGLFEENLYFGTASGTVQRYGGSYDDSGTAITVRVLPAFTIMRNSSGKRASIVRPIIQAAEGVKPSFEMRFDYDVRTMTVSVVTTSLASALWDTATWDVTPWLPPISPYLKWQSASGMGVAVSVAMAMATDTKIILQGFDVVIEQGGIL